MNPTSGSRNQSSYFLCHPAKSKRRGFRKSLCLMFLLFCTPAYLFNILFKTGRIDYLYYSTHIIYL